MEREVIPLKQDINHNQPNRLKRVRSISLAEDKWFARYKQLAANEPQHVLLESGRGGRTVLLD